jgi:hypothetical protein
MSTDAQATEHLPAGVRETLQRLIALVETVRLGMVELHDKLPATPEELTLGDLAEAPGLPRGCGRTSAASWPM